MCKRLFIVLALFVCGIAGVWADEIDEKQALNEAKAFLASHRSTSISGGKKMSSNTTLKLQGKVSGLYVFNATDGSGFIIVSNDDQTTPILGFGENGNIDTEKMPANMRAWLQGYADEIAWLQKNGGKIAKARADIGATRNLGGHATKEIPPLVATTWNQSAPYWNLTPYYKESDNNILLSKDYQSGYTHCATGCVATAMAQVMKYHQWPQTTAAIPDYQWTSTIWLPNKDESLPAVTFDWANMVNHYTNSETDAQKTAVATLMQYCGYSVKMDYGPESGSNTDRVAFALKEYFDYKSTTKFVSRSMYTLAKWSDLIYHELSQNRPVVYGGSSSGGGHEFVCDGYQYRNGTDFFHINWGWGGSNDEYYVLSSLNPYGTQGIGGSSSNDGFHYGQDAVIGIQPSNGTGTVADITPNVINLTLNSMTLSNNPAIAGLPMNVTINVTNNSAEDYDGDIWVGIKEVKQGETNYYLIDGDNFFIPAGETVDCVGSFTPTETGTYDLVFFLPNAVGSYNTDGEVRATLTVEEATTNDLVPVYGYYVDEYSRSQFVIPATNLEGMLYANLNGMTFYSTSSSSNWGTAKFDVYLSEASESSISALKDWDSLEKVYAGALSISNGKMVITFDNSYQYMGGNLLVGINQTVSDGDSYSHDYWIGTSATGASMGGYDTSISQNNFLPYTTFDYTLGTIPTCLRPTNLALVGEPAYNSVQLTWTPGSEGQDAWQLCVNGDKDNLIDVNTYPYSLTGLSQETEYTVKIRGNCGSGNVSAWSSEITFTTPEQFASPTALVASNVTFNSASISWTGSAESYNLRYRTIEETVFSDDFENGMDNWTIVRNGAGTTSTDWRLFNPNNFSTNSFPAHSGNYAAMSRSWASSAYNVDNWLISPKVALGGTMKFWVIDDGTYHEHYEVYVSTTTNDISSFTKVYEPGDASDTWTEVTVDLSAFIGQNGYVAIRHKDEDQNYLLIDDVTIIGINPTSDWTTVNNVTSPYSLTGLTENRLYQVEVQGNYTEVTSNWNSVRFNTPESNPVPTDLVAALVADGATFTWMGTGDRYNVQYRMAANEETFFYEDFENGLDQWSIIRHGEGTANTDWQTVSAATYFDDPTDAHSGNYVAMSRSWYNNIAYDVDNWLISPQVTLDGMLRFWVKDDGQYHEHYDIYVSTTGKAIADFTLLDSPGNASGTWTEVSVDLSGYAGQKGYIALRNTDNDQDYLLIDDFGIYGIATPAGSWQSLASVTETTATLSGLATNNGYEYRIQSVKDGNTSDWSETGEFALLTLQDEADNNSLIYNNTGRLAHVTLSRRTLFKDGYWNTLCLPFSLNATQLASAQMDNADIRTLDNAAFSGSTLTLNFADKSAITAGTPYIIKWEGDGSKNLQNPVFANVTIDKTMHDVPCNLGDGNAVTFKGTYKKLAYTEDTPSILFLGDESTLYYPKANASIGAQRAYFELTGITAGKPASIGGIRAYVLNYGNETTGIRSIENGKLKIENEADAWYSLDGRKLNGKPTRKGLYIHNGNKVVIK